MSGTLSVSRLTSVAVCEIKDGDVSACGAKPPQTDACELFSVPLDLRWPQISNQSDGKYLSNATNAHRLQETVLIKR